MMGIERTLLFLALALLAEILGTLGGFGSSVFFVPIANLFFDFESVLDITALFHLSGNLSKLGLFRIRAACGLAGASGGADRAGNCSDPRVGGSGIGAINFGSSDRVRRVSDSGTSAVSPGTIERVRAPGGSPVRCCSLPVAAASVSGPQK